MSIPRPGCQHLLVLLLLLTCSACWGQIEFEKPPVNYGQAISTDPVAQLIKKMAAGEVKLAYDEKLGWLPSVLQSLNIDPESQVLVFSKTSLQLHKISPRTPRAVYFNEDVYVGFCQKGEVLEIAATDPELGALFYTLDQTKEATKVVADRGQCLTCHASSRTHSVPGYLVRSVFADFNGRPRSGTRAFVSDHSSEFLNRFGGWYVSGDHGDLRHLGNMVARDRVEPEKVDSDKGANITDLGDLFNTDPYLTPNSDIVALMVLEHQSQMHNLFARAGMETRSAVYLDEGINEALGRPKGTLSESTKRRMARAGDEVVRYMLFAEEIPFDSKIQGNTRFVEVFRARADEQGQVDSKGRSLRDFDLTTRMFKYPCSYMVYTDALQKLPGPTYDLIRQRLYEVLTAKDSPTGYERLSGADRQAVLEILTETLPHMFDGLTASNLNAS